VAVSDPFVATVGGVRISVARLEQRVAELRRGPRGRHIPPSASRAARDVERWIVQELVNEAVLAYEARAAGLAGRGGGQPHLVSTFSPLSPDQVARLVRLVTADVTVTDHDLRAYYGRNLDLYRRPEARRIRHLILPTRAAAARTARRLAGGEDLGDELQLHRGELTGALEDAIFGASIGAVIGPIRTEHGWHLARLEGATDESLMPYEDARAQIEAELLVAARSRAFDEWLERRRQALVVIEPAFEHPAHPVHGVPSHRH